jgi:hypothetical protein
MDEGRLGLRETEVFSLSLNQEGRGDMQRERTLPCGVGPDETQSKSASVRGFESHPPHQFTRDS